MPGCWAGGQAAEGPPTRGSPLWFLPDPREPPSERGCAASNPSWQGRILPSQCCLEGLSLLNHCLSPETPGEGGMPGLCSGPPLSPVHSWGAEPGTWPRRPCTLCAPRPFVGQEEARQPLARPGQWKQSSERPARDPPAGQARPHTSRLLGPDWSGLWTGGPSLSQAPTGGREWREEEEG